MFQPPKRMKYRKAHKGRNRGVITNPRVCFGDYGMVSIGRSRLTARQIEAARRTLTRFMKRDGKVWIRVFPDKPITKKPLEVRQGKGKGSVEYYVYEVKPGTMIFEVSGVTIEQAREAFRLAGSKLPFKVNFMQKEEDAVAC
ncbi:MAG TPA: 50S ribosomal protein L16 [Gammaproteobacteria bacterium]|nr:50S ribosomal protein L16 [Gammaproteobacteria bacterium]